MYLLRDSEPNEAQVVERSHHRLSYRVFILYERELPPFTLSTAVRAVLNAAIFFPNIASKCLQRRGGPY